jgi:preprotein translocase subunit SecD
MRDKNVRHAGIAREGDAVVIRFRDAEMRDKARAARSNSTSRPAAHRARTAPTSSWRHAQAGGAANMQDFAIKQNITTLHNRINELGVLPSR